MKRLNTAYRAGRRGGDRQPRAPVGGVALRRGQRGRRARAPAAASARSATPSARAEQRLEELRASELAQLLDRAMAAAAAGGDLLADMRRDAEAALVRARARLAELQGRFDLR